LPLTPGTRIAARFEVTGPLGAGSMGEVYQAHDLKLHRDVAVKLLSPALATSQEHLRRFEREARAASALSHPNICTIYDVGRSPEAGDRPYLVMELLRGQTLYDMLAGGKLPVGTVVNLGVQLADALEVAHHAGIIHRDIKPANVFVTARGDAKLLDFGLAAVTEAADPNSGSSGEDGTPRRPASLTHPGAAVGTVLYMSPEQALGDPLDGRTDLFSLGLVLYEMITGTRAFDGRSTTAIVDSILHATPPGLDPQTASAIPRDLRALLSRLLEKDRDRRPASAGEVALLLRAVQSGSIAGREYAAARSGTSMASGSLEIGSEIYNKAAEFTPSQPVSSGLSHAFEGRSFRGVGSIALAMLLLVMAGYFALSWYRGPASSLASREPLLLADFANTTGEGVFDGALKDALEIQLRQSPYMNVVPASQVQSALQLMERAPNERLTAAVAHDLCQRMGVKAILLGSIAPLGRAYVIGIEAQACRSGDVIAREQVQAASKTDVITSVGAAAARIREQLGESIGSIQRFNAPVQHATTSSLEALKAYSLGVETRIRTGEVQAIPFFEHALELDPNFALAAARLASIYTNLRELEQAQPYMQRAFARSDSLSEPERLFVKANYHYIVTGQLEEAVAAYRLWIDTYPQDWIPHINLSTTYERLARIDEALREAQEGLRLGPNAVVPYQQVARLLLNLDRYEEARTVLGDAGTHGFDSSFNRSLLYDLAYLDGNAGAMNEHLRAAVARPDGYLVLAEAARAAVAIGRIEASRSLYAQAVTAARSARIEDYAGGLLAEQAVNDALLGDRARAREGLQKALEVGRGIETMWPAALAATFAGQADRAAQIAERYRRAAPPAADVVQAFAPLLAAAAAVTKGDGRGAVEALASATPYDRVVGPWLPYVRGLAHAAANDRVRAAGAFRDVIGQRGNQPTHPLRTLARLQLARALRAAGLVAEAREAYADFAAAWSAGDRGHPLLAAATREAAALQAAEPSSEKRR
jgi:serine/threonine protein kinase/Tfp pilus assembly protein PilF